MLVIPTYNEKENIRKLVEELRKYSPEIKILFVDDSSPDGTAEEIRELMKTDLDISLLQREKKGGLGSAYIYAFKHVIANGLADFVISMDADLSHPAELVPKLIAVGEKYDVVVGSRYVSGGNVENWNLFRKLISKFGNVYARIFSQIKIRDLTSGFVFYSVASLNKIDLDDIRAKGYAFQIDLKKRLYESGAKISEIPITFVERREGRSKFNFNIFLEGILYPLKNAFKKTAFLAGLAVLLGSFIVYALSAAHSITLNDNAEFITAAASFGIAHPPGYPLYTILSGLFSLLPLGSLPFRVNLFTALLSSLALLTLFLIIKKIIFFERKENKIGVAAIAATVLCLSFSRIYWFQSINAKVYTLNLLLILLLLNFAIDYTRTKEEGKFYWFAFVTGLALANHPTAAIISPFLFLVFIKSRPALNWVKALALFLIGISFYLFLPLRSAFHPVLDWGHVSRGFQAFYYHISRGQYKDISVSSGLRDKYLILSSFFLLLWTELKWLLIPAVLGLFWLARRDKKIFYLCLAVFVANSFGIIALRSLPYSAETVEYYSTYYLPALAVVTILAACGTFWLCTKIRFGYYAVTLLVLLFCFYQLKTNLNYNDFSKVAFVQKYSEDTYASLPANAVLLFGEENAAEDTTLFSYLYVEKLKQIRPDVQTVAYIDVFEQKDNRAVNDTYQSSDPNERHRALVVYAEKIYPNRPLFATFILDDKNFQSFSNGYVYEISDRNSKMKNTTAIKQDAPSNEEQKILGSDYFGSQYLADYYYAQAAYQLDRGNFNDSQQQLIKAIKFDQDVIGYQYKNYLKHRDAVLAIKR